MAPDTIAARGFHLKYVQGQTWKQAARELGVSKTVLRGRVRRYIARTGIDIVPFTATDTPQDGVLYQQNIDSENAHSVSTTSRLDDAKHIKTLDELLAYCEVDLEEWVVDHYIVNKWPLARKDIKKEITWTGGVMDGYVEDTGELTQAGLIQVKAWLVRKEPVELLPVFRIIQPRGSYQARPKPAPKVVSRALIFSDVHFGFLRPLDYEPLVPMHDRRVLDLILQLALTVKPDRVDVLGDIFDLPDWTDKFIRSPLFLNVTQPAMLEASWFFEQLRALLPGIPITAHQGNHEKRIDTAIKRYLPAAYELKSVTAYKLGGDAALSIPELCGFTQLGINWLTSYPDDWDWLVPGLLLQHGDIVRDGGGNSAAALVKKSTFSSICGHGHKPESAGRAIWTEEGRRYIKVTMAGCSCHTDGRVPANKTHNDWGQSIEVVDYHADGTFDVNSVSIVEGVAIYNRECFVARSYENDLSDSYPEFRWN